MKTVIMTGSSSGIGRVAFNRLQTEKGLQVIAGARTISKNCIFVNLANLESVKEFARQSIALTNGSKINMLILNAGIQSNGQLKSLWNFYLADTFNKILLIFQALLLHCKYPVRK